MIELRLWIGVICLLLAGILYLLNQIGAMLADYIATHDAHFHQAIVPNENAGVHCPECGSPRHYDISGMGKHERKCLDCSAVFQP